MFLDMRARTASDEAYTRLRDALTRGLYAPGSRLPGERALAAELEVSRETIRAALDRLEADGALSRSAQRGWFVPRQTVGEPPSVLQSFTEMARQRGLTATAMVLEQKVRAATFEEAAKLGIAPSAQVLSLIRLRGMSGTPVCVDANVIPVTIAGALAETDMADASLYDQLDRVSGVRIRRSAYSVQADGASTEIAPQLGIPVGSPVLIGREVAYAHDGSPVLLGVNTYRGDAYRFEADLYRPIS